MEKKPETPEEYEVMTTESMHRHIDECDSAVLITMKGGNVKEIVKMKGDPGKHLQILGAMNVLLNKLSGLVDEAMNREKYRGEFTYDPSNPFGSPINIDKSKEN